MECVCKMFVVLVFFSFVVFVLMGCIVVFFEVLFVCDCSVDDVGIWDVVIVEGFIG